MTEQKIVKIEKALLDYEVVLRWFEEFSHMIKIESEAYFLPK